MFNMFDISTYKNIYSPEFYIESFQNTKSFVTDKIITDKTLNKAAHNFIDAQTSFAKVLLNNSLDVAQYSADSVAKVWFPKEIVKETTKSKAL